MADLDELERLLAAATPGPVKPMPIWCIHKQTERSVRSPHPEVPDEMRAETVYTYSPPSKEKQDHDSALFLALRNAAPALIAELRALRALRECVENLVADKRTGVHDVLAWQRTANALEEAKEAGHE